MALPRRDPGAAEFERVVRVGELAREAAPADTVAGFEHDDGQAARRQRFRRGRAGEAGADDEDVGNSGHRRRLSLIVMVVLGTTIHEFADNHPTPLMETRGWSDQVRP